MSIQELIQKNKSEPINPTHISLVGKEECDNRNSKFIIDLIDAVIEEEEKSKRPTMVNGLIMPVKAYNNAKQDTINRLKEIRACLE